MSEMEFSIKQMKKFLRMRGYRLKQLKPYDKIKEKDSDIEAKFLIGIRTDPEEEKIIALNCPLDVLGVAWVRDVVKVLEEEGINEGLIYGAKRATPAAKRTAKEFNIEIHNPSPLSQELFDHVYVPKHTILKPKDVDELKRKYNLKVSQLPWISTLDPVIQLIGARPGDIVKIKRKSRTAGTTIAYRLVRSPNE